MSCRWCNPPPPLLAPIAQGNSALTRLVVPRNIAGSHADEPPMRPPPPPSLCPPWPSKATAPSPTLTYPAT
eukprot:5013-Chlamydomonas_euryale.AAC.1